MIKIDIDFETYSELDLKKYGIYRYARHSTTEVLCMSYSINNAKPEIYIAGDDPPTQLFEAITDKSLFYAFNAEFEIEIYNEICVKKLEWPSIPFLCWRDIQAIVANLSLPLDLESCGIALKLGTLKEERGKDLIELLCKPQRITKKQPHRRLTPDIVPHLFQELYDYCKQDVRAEQAILKALPYELNDKELNLWRANVIKNYKGIPIDRKLANRIIDITDYYLDNMTSIIPVLTDGEVQKIGQGKKIIEWCRKQGFILDNFQKKTISNVLKNSDIDKFPSVKAILTLRQLIGKNSTKKFETILRIADEYDRIHSCYQYHGTSTGRDAGRLVNPLNMSREKVKNTEELVNDFLTLSTQNIIIKYPNLLKTVAALIRPVILAPKGYKFVVADYSSIENIVLLWLAGQYDILQLIIDGLDQYTDMAATIYDQSYESITDKKRQFGKKVVLGAQFGMWYETFYKNCILEGIDITKEQAKYYIQTFRNKYNKVKQFWYDLEKEAIRAIEHKGLTYSVGKISFIYYDRYLFMILPNGKPLAYAYPEVEKEKTHYEYRKYILYKGLTGETKKWETQYLNKTRLVENVTQATAREIFSSATLNVLNEGHEIFITVYDELGVITPEKNGLTIKELINTMCRLEPCFEGLPLSASGYESKRYKKD